MIDLSKIENKARQDGLDVRIVFKEYLHFVILNFFFEKGFFNEIVFQGGTALRFAYQGVRYSQDLDFVFKRKNKGYFDKLPVFLEILPDYLKRWFLKFESFKIKLQKKSSDFQRYILLAESDSLTIKDKTQIEFAFVPSYEWQVLILKKESIPLEPAVAIETPREILSDKVVALGAREYLKGRDLWDIYFLTTTLKVDFDRKIIKMVEKKIYDYNLNKNKFKRRIKDTVSTLEEKGKEALKREMVRFLPRSYRIIFENRYSEILKICEGILNRIISS